MRTWKLSAGDPLHLTLAADIRLGPTDYANDIIWELNLGQGEPPALAVQTNFGLRARWMQFFPIFYRAGTSVIDPAAFHTPPQVVRILPNYCEITYAPFDGIEARAEYRVASSQALAGRLRLTNKSVLPHNLRLDWVCVLNPLGFGEGMAAMPMGLGTALQGRTDGLAVVCYLLGGPQPNKGPYPGLSLQYELYPGASVESNWAAAAHAVTDEAFDLAQAAAGRPWEAETARIELRNSADLFDIITGEPDWDVAFALGQRAACSLLMANPEHLPATSFVLSRRIDQGASAKGDGSDHPYLWSGQTALDSCYLASLLPGCPALAEGLVRNFLSAAEKGYPDFKPGLAGQRTRHLAQPLLASLALQSSSQSFLEESYPALLDFFKVWLGEDYDPDGDGLPQWEHPIQTGLESSPLYDRWNPNAQGLEIAFVESPGLGAMLCREARSLAEIAARLGRTDDLPWLEAQNARIRQVVERMWDRHDHLYRYRDAFSHTSRAGRELLSFQGPGEFPVRRKLPTPVRVVIQIEAEEESTRAVIAHVHGVNEEGAVFEETLSPRDFTWSRGHGWTTSRQIFSQVTRVELVGPADSDRGRMIIPDFTLQDLSLFLPLWAGIPDEARAKYLVEKHLLGRYLETYGLPLCPPDKRPADPPELAGVAMPWNAWLGEGLLAAGYRTQAADLVTRLMEAVLTSLKKGLGFRQYYHASSGQGLGERDHLWGLPPLGLFLRTAGLERITPNEIIVRGSNPFPWPITVKYQRMTITREGEKTTLALPGRQPVVTSGEQLQRIFLS
jgi:hypothetical protein